MNAIAHVVPALPLASAAPAPLDAPLIADTHIAALAADRL